MTRLFFDAAFIAYLLGLSASVVSFVSRRELFYRLALGTVILGFGLHSMFLISSGIERGHFPISDLPEALAFFAWTVSLCFLISYVRYQIRALGLFLMPLVAALMLGTIVFKASPVPKLFESYWIYLHAICIFLGYGMLFIAFVAGFLYLMQEMELKSKKPSTFYRRLPSLLLLDDVFNKFLIWGFTLMTVGLLAGVVWAEQEWVSGWQKDPKVLSAIITWFIYLILIYFRLTAGWRGKRAALLSMAGFISALFAFLGASFFGGLHSF